MGKLVSRLVCVAILIFLSIPVHASSQALLLGGKVAGQSTTFSNEFAPDVIHEDKFVFGPMAEIRLSNRFSIEVDALYKRKLNYTATSSSRLSGGAQLRNESHDVTARSWEIPVIVKLYPSKHSLRPFVAGGFSSRNVSGTTNVSVTVSGTPPIPPPTFESDVDPGDVVNPWTYGITFGAGVSMRAGIFLFQPELRYTGWLSSPFSFPTKLDSFQILMGIGLGKKAAIQ
jgi:hypothetical protein